MSKKYVRPDGPMRCVVYARYSSSNQREISAEEQVRFCKEFINQHGYIFVGEYVDKELTGKNANRKQFRDMLYDSQFHKFDMVVVYKNDRFARNVYDKVFNREILKKNGVVINYVKEEILNSDGPEAILYGGLSDAMAEYYSYNLAREVMEKGLLPNAHESKHNGGIPPLGLDVVDSHYIVNEAEARIVRLIFDLYINHGYGYKQIAEELNSRGYLNKRGTLFVPSSIRDMLLNEKYTGTYVYNRRASKNDDGKRNNSQEKSPDEVIRIPDAFPAIIEKDIFDRVKTCMDARKGRNATNQAKEPYYLSGLIKCGQCGHSMSGNRKGKNRDGTPQAEYRCNTRDKKGSRECSTKGINKKYIETAVEHYISTLCTGKNFPNVMSALIEYAKSQTDTVGEQEQVKKELNKVEKKIGNIVKAIAGGFDADELKSEYALLKSRKTALQSELRILEEKSKESLTFNEEEVKQALMNLRDIVKSPKDADNLKQVYAKFIDCVEVHEGYVTIALKILAILGYRRYSYPILSKKMPPLDFHQMVAWNGGAEGNRTPVRKQLGKNFSGRSLLFTFPRPDGNKHPSGFGSFIMHGMRKALHTHGLHSNHTLARLVDLPGRMGA